MNTPSNADHDYRLRRLLSKHVMVISDIDAEIFIQVWHEPGHADGYDYYFECSHHVHTPVQADAYITSRPYNTSESSALTQAIDGIMSYYKEAKLAGHMPSKSWLITNRYYSNH